MTKSTDSPIFIFGIRHHGPGSARSVRRALERLQPDVILIEGPPDADHLLPLIADAALQPPVALLLYVPAQPQHAVFYPFAQFSPEWQALQFATQHNIPARFMDLPQAFQLARDEGRGMKDEKPTEPLAENQHSTISNQQSAIPIDPLYYLAQAAGYDDGERWWEDMVEQRRDDADLFAAILEAMTAVREQFGEPREPIEPLREAHMRQTIRAAQREGYQRIAVICGAWHTPSLANMPPAKDDVALLKGLPKVKVEATWIPWTHQRLSYFTGYGAGIESPGWYQHVWQWGDRPSEVTTRWLAKVGRLLREADLDASAAHLIEAVRLAEALAALRQRPRPGLSELNEAVLTVLCFGQDAPLRLIHNKLIVGEVLGQVPASAPVPPLQRDLEREQKRLRLAPEAVERILDLDLRQPLDLERSHLLQRLRLLNIPWGTLQRTGNTKGTFHELWKLQWQPELIVRTIEAGVWGNTLLDATTAFSIDTAQHAEDLPALTKLVENVLLADLPDAIEPVMTRVQAQAAVASDTTHLMAALPPLANVMRYGNVRQTDVSAVGQVVDGLVARISIGLPGACASLNDEAAATMFDHLTGTHHAIGLLQNDEYSTGWYGTLNRLLDQTGVHGLIAGRCARLLFDQHQITADEAARRLSLALSIATEPAQAAAWIDGFLRGSGQLLLHDDGLWNVIDAWVTNLSPDTFKALLPLLRRTFSTFPAPERRQIGERVKEEAGSKRQEARGNSEENFDVERAEKVLPLITLLLGVNHDEARGR